ncbi:chromosomal replication initiator protein DnaA [Rubrivirga sp. S365]|uniref:chromosomal replication initiator protein DnaA n=1 Tax=Rubrivirga sp. S365 TaxID=3076080 RepID=UPI0028C5F268|nr:chromosomal replication initiator protein DnaA [Rubrivirga sp. S365]MDT7855414.1 chromosomal replication initiator protein DnaA [Rubrivirga sp. S365]
MDRSRDEVWTECLGIIRDNISRQSFRTWFEPLRAVGLVEEGGEVKLTVQLPSRFYYEWLEEHYFGLLRKTITKVLGPGGRLYYDIVIERDEPAGAGHGRGSSMELPARQPANVPPPASERPPPADLPAGVTPPRPPADARPDAGRPYRADAGRGAARRPAPAAPAAAEAAHPAHPFAIPGVRPIEVDPHLNDSYTFERFIEGDCNRLARAAAWSIAQAPGATSFNPFMIYGGVGLGKTHLIQAIGNYARANGHARTVRYVSSEMFTAEFVQSIQTNRINEFSQFYRGIDILIVDDVQFFGGKEKTQEEFFHIFNELHQQGKQIVLSGDRPPRDIAGIEDRLLSRFGWGLTADVQPPDVETRIAILNRRATDDGTRVRDEVIEYVATHVKSNIRELEGALIRLQAHAALTSREIDLDLARDVLKDLIKESRPQLTIEAIQSVVCDYLAIPEDLVRARTRKREVVQARQVAMYFSKEITKHSLKTIGLHFGGRDHSTVIHAVRSVDDQIETDPSFREMVVAVRKKLELHQR